MNFSYAYVCNILENQAIIKSLFTEKNIKVKSIIQLDNSKKATWNQTKEGLILNIPNYAKNEIPITGFKITLE